MATTWRPIGETDVNPEGGVSYSPVDALPPVPEGDVVDPFEVERKARMWDRQAQQRATAPKQPDLNKFAREDFEGLPNNGGFWDMLTSSEFWTRDVEPRFRSTVQGLTTGALGAPVDLSILGLHTMKYIAEGLRGNPNDMGFLKDMPDFSKSALSSDWFAKQLGWDYENLNYTLGGLLSPEGAVAGVAKAGMIGTVLFTRMIDQMKASGLIEEVEKAQKLERNRDRAVKMHENGFGPSTLWSETGWVNVNGEWKFWQDVRQTKMADDLGEQLHKAVLDSKAIENPLDRIRTGTFKGPTVEIDGRTYDQWTVRVPMGAAWENPDLYKIAPELKDVPLNIHIIEMPLEDINRLLERRPKAHIETKDGTAYLVNYGPPTASFFPDSNRVEVFSAQSWEDIRKTLAHEVSGHMVQAIEMQQTGGNMLAYFDFASSRGYQTPANVRLEVAQFIYDDALAMFLRRKYGEGKRVVFDRMPKEMQTQVYDEFAEFMNTYSPKFFEELIATPFSVDKHLPLYGDPMTADLMSNFRNEVAAGVAGAEESGGVADWIKSLERSYQGESVYKFMFDQATRRHQDLYTSSIPKVYNDFMSNRTIALSTFEALFEATRPTKGLSDTKYKEAFTQFAKEWPPSVEGGFTNDVDMNAFTWYLHQQGEAFARLEELGSTPEGLKIIADKGPIRAIMEDITYPLAGEDLTRGTFLQEYAETQGGAPFYRDIESGSQVLENELGIAPLLSGPFRAGTSIEQVNLEGKTRKELVDMARQLLDNIPEGAVDPARNQLLKKIFEAMDNESLVP